MKDFLGNELSINDNVVIIRPKYKELVKAIVIRFTKNYVFVEYKPHFGDIKSEIKQTPNQIIKI